MEVMRVWFLSCDFVCAVITDGHSLNQKFEACWYWGSKTLAMPGISLFF
jgi:hypothetical protein